MTPTDEIATMTLADIYASQGYAAKALRIYREVYRRQSGNAELRAKIEALEARERAAEPAPEPAEKPETPAAPVPPPVPAHAHPGPTESAAHAHAPAAPVGAPIDEGRSYEQFKRWLKAMSG